MWRGSSLQERAVAYDNGLRPVNQSVNGGHTITLRYNLDGLLAGDGIDSLYRMGRPAWWTARCSRG